MTTVVIQKKIPSITVRSQGGVLSQNPSTATTLVNQGSQNSLGSLNDVVPGANGGVLVYDAGTNKYIVTQPNFSNTALNGGEF